MTTSDIMRLARDANIKIITLDDLDEFLEVVSSFPSDTKKFIIDSIPSECFASRRTATVITHKDTDLSPEDVQCVLSSKSSLDPTEPYRVLDAILKKRKSKGEDVSEYA